MCITDDDIRHDINTLIVMAKLNMEYRGTECQIIHYTGRTTWGSAEQMCNRSIPIMWYRHDIGFKSQSH